MCVTLQKFIIKYINIFQKLTLMYNCIRLFHNTMSITHYAEYLNMIVINQ